MKSILRHVLATAAALAAFGVGGSLSPLAAQQVCRSTPPDDVRRILIPTFRAATPALAVQAADEVRERAEREFSCRDLLILPKKDIVRFLEASGYRTDTSLSPTDARTLASSMRADEYLTGTVTRDGGNYRINASLVLARNNALVQPLPTVLDGDLDDAAEQVIENLQVAKRQLEAEARCVDLAREGDYRGAAAAARQGIAAYPRATLARLCLLEMYSQLNLGPDSIAALTREILEIDPQSRIALEYAAVAYDSLGQEDMAVDAWTRLIAADPTNTRLVERAIAYLVTSGQASRAKPIIDEAVAQNPGDPALQRLRWLVLLTIKDWRGAYEAGEMLVQIDTAMADTLFYQRLVSAYAGDSLPQKAADAAARGIAKFPDHASLHALHAQMLRASGQLPQAAIAARRAVELDPSIQRGWVQVAQIRMELSMPDSAAAALRSAVASGGDSAFVAQYALSLGNQLYREANASKNSVSADSSRAAFGRAMSFLSLSNEIAPSAPAAFLLGVSAFAVGQSAATEAPRSKSCQLARLADESFTTAQINIPRGAEVSQQAAGQYMQFLTQFTPVVENQIKQFCG
ncbi:MAG: tetratricopeptide repeat protein [Gemmatimonadaceae bacterium]